MLNIVKIVLKTRSKQLDVIFTDTVHKKNSSISLSFEYLRVFSPAELQKASSAKSTSSTPAVFHKLNVIVNSIEPVGKHGHRIAFNDGFSDIYSDNDLLTLSQSFEHNWKEYLASLSSINSREESINFKPVT